MAYNLAYLRNRVLVDKLDDDSIDGSIIDNFLNDTQRAVFTKYELPFMETIFEGLLPAGNNSFNFPTDFSLLQSLILTDPVDYEYNLTKNYLPFREFNEVYPTPRNNDATAPRMWTTYGGKLYLAAPTDQDYNLTVFYLKNPKTLSDDNDVPAIPQEYEEVLVLGAYYRALERNEDFDLAAQVKQDYADAVASLTGRNSKRQTGKPAIMTQPSRVAPTRTGKRRS